MENNLAKALNLDILWAEYTEKTEARRQAEIALAEAKRAQSDAVKAILKATGQKRGHIIDGEEKTIAIRNGNYFFKTPRKGKPKDQATNIEDSESTDE